MPVQVSDLGGLKLDLLVQVDSLLSNHVQLINLVLDDRLSLVESGVDFFDLLHNFTDLGSSFNDHLIAILDLFR